jgi:hypothetical protein
MKPLRTLKIAAVVSLFALSGQTASYCQVLATWTFETSLPAANQGAGTWFTNIAPEIGSGTASALHSGPSIYTSPVGNGSTHSMSSTNWAVGDLYQFVVSTVGSTGIAVSYDQISSATGPGKFNFQYSTDGINFTTFATDYTVIANASPNTWGSGSHSAASFYSYDLSSISALNNNPTVYFRVVDDSTTSANGGTVGTGGTDRVDNFSVSVVPEPCVPALGGLGVLAMMVFRRRKLD